MRACSIVLIVAVAISVIPTWTSASSNEDCERERQSVDYAQLTSIRKLILVGDESNSNAFIYRVTAASLTVQVPVSFSTTSAVDISAGQTAAHSKVQCGQTLRSVSLRCKSNHRSSDTPVAESTAASVTYPECTMQQLVSMTSERAAVSPCLIHPRLLYRHEMHPLAAAAADVAHTSASIVSIVSLRRDLLRLRYDQNSTDSLRAVSKLLLELFVVGRSRLSSHHDTSVAGAINFVANNATIPIDTWIIGSGAAMVGALRVLGGVESSCEVLTQLDDAASASSDGSEQPCPAPVMRHTVAPRSSKPLHIKLRSVPSAPRNSSSSTDSPNALTTVSSADSVALRYAAHYQAMPDVAAVAAKHGAEYIERFRQHVRIKYPSSDLPESPTSVSALDDARPVSVEPTSSSAHDVDQGADDDRATQLRLKRLYLLAQAVLFSPTAAVAVNRSRSHAGSAPDSSWSAISSADGDAADVDQDNKRMRKAVLALWSTHTKVASLLETGLLTREAFGAIIDPILNNVPPMMAQSAQQAIKSPAADAIGAGLSEVLVEGLSNPALDLLKPMLSNWANEHAQTEDMRVMVDGVLQELASELPGLIEAQISRSASRALTSGLTEELTHSIVKALVEILTDSLITPITAMTTKMLVQPLTHTLALTITNAMQRSPRGDIICRALCIGKGQKASCGYCQSAENYYYDHIASYYVQYYSRYYTNAYAAYYSELFRNAPPPEAQAGGDESGGGAGAGAPASADGGQSPPADSPPADAPAQQQQEAPQDQAESPPPDQEQAPSDAGDGT